MTTESGACIQTKPSGHAVSPGGLAVSPLFGDVRRRLLEEPAADLNTLAGAQILTSKSMEQVNIPSVYLAGAVILAMAGMLAGTALLALRSRVARDAGLPLPF